MRKEFLVLILSLIVCFGLPTDPAAQSNWTGGLPSRGAGSESTDAALERFRVAFGQARTSGIQLSTRDDSYVLFSDILIRTLNRYVRPTNPGDLVDRAIEGLAKRVATNPGSTDGALIEAALETMLGSLDPYSAFLNEGEYKSMQALTQGEFGGLGIELTADEKSGLIKVVSPIDGTPAARAGIRAGDLIAQIDGTEVRGLTLREAVNRMRGDSGSKVRLTLHRPTVNSAINVTLTRAVIKIEPVRFKIEGTIGYVRITTFNQNTAVSLDHAVESIQHKLGPRLSGIILDLRNNPGGLLDQAIAVADRFLVNDEIVSVRGRDPSESRTYPAEADDLVAGLPIVVLINGGSASASEIVAAALQDHKRAVLFGTRSYGKGSVQTVSPLPGGETALRLTTARYYRPAGTLVDCFGVSPNLEVVPSNPDGVQSAEPEAHQNAAQCDPAATPPAPPQTWTIKALCPHLAMPAKPGEDRPMECALEAIRGTLVAHR